MNYDDSYSRGPRVSLSSLLLLVIFVSAAALIVAAIIWMPWASNSDTAVSQPSASAAAQQVTADGTPAPDPNAPQGP